MFWYRAKKIHDMNIMIALGKICVFLFVVRRKTKQETESWPEFYSHFDTYFRLTYYKK